MQEMDWLKIRTDLDAGLEIIEETDVMADYVEHLRESSKSTNKVPNVGVTAEQFTDGLKHLSDLGHSIRWQGK